MIPDPAQDLPWSILELCCGGFGGWSRAVLASDQLAQHFRVTTALDNCQVAVDTYCANFHATPTFYHTVPDFRSLDKICLRENLDPGCIHAMQSVRCHHVFTASLPCQPWSDAVRARGLRSPDGELWKEMAKTISVSRPVIVLLENVASIVKHPDWPEIASLLKSCHCRFPWETTDASLDEVSCTSRPRWLALGQKCCKTQFFSICLDRVALDRRSTIQDSKNIYQ